MGVKFNKPNLGGQLLSVALSFAVSASALASVTSAPTTTVKGRAPTMAVPTITHGDVNGNGKVDAGDTLTAVPGAISDLDLDTPIASTYRWNDGTSDLDTLAVYTIMATDLGKRITLFAQPHTDPTVTDPADGPEVASTGLDVATADSLVSVAVSGEVNGFPQVGTNLIATPTCLGACGVVSYQWQLESSPGGGSYSDISGATSDTYTPLRGDQLRRIRVVASN